MAGPVLGLKASLHKHAAGAQHPACSPFLNGQHLIVGGEQVPSMHWHSDAASSFLVFMQIIFSGALTCCSVILQLQDQNCSILEISEKFLGAAPDAEPAATTDTSQGCTQEEHSIQSSE